MLARREIPRDQLIRFASADFNWREWLVAAQQLNLDNIQGNILAGFNKDHQCFLFVNFPDGSDPKGWLSEILPAPTRVQQRTTGSFGSASAGRSLVGCTTRPSADRAGQRVGN
jgi:hypothetical protein